MADRLPRTTALLPPHVRVWLENHRVPVTIDRRGTKALSRQYGFPTAGFYHPEQRRIGIAEDVGPGGELKMNKRPIPRMRFRRPHPALPTATVDVQTHEAAHAIAHALNLESDPHLIYLFNKYCGNRPPHQGPWPYGCRDPKEFFAEMMSAYWNGQPLPDDVYRAARSLDTWILLSDPKSTIDAVTKFLMNMYRRGNAPVIQYRPTMRY